MRARRHVQSRRADSPSSVPAHLNMASSAAGLTMSQLRDMILAAARDSVAAGTWLGDVRSFASLDVLEECRRGRPNDTALQCCDDDWDVFAVSLAQMHALSLRACEVLLRRTSMGGLDARHLLYPPNHSFTAMAAALVLLRQGVAGVALPPGADAAALAVRSAVVASALLASGTLHQLARVLAAARQLLQQASKQQQQPPSEQLCGPSAGLYASEQQAPPARAQSPRLSLGVVCTELLAGSARVLRMVVEGARADARALPAAFAALGDSQLLEHTAAMVLAVRDAVARSSSSSSSSSSGDETTCIIGSIDRAAVHMFAASIGDNTCSVFQLVTGSPSTAAASTSLGSSASGSSSSGGCSTTASGDSSVTALGAGCHCSLKHDAMQLPQHGAPAAASAAGTADALHASCSGEHLWTEVQLPTKAAVGGGFVMLAHDHFLRGPMLQSLLAMQLRLALHALEADRQSAGGTAGLGAGEAPDSLGLVNLVGSATMEAGFPDYASLEAMPCVLCMCHLAMCAAPHSPAATTSSAASADGGAQLLGSKGAVPACSPGLVAALVARVVIACASRLDDCHTLSLHSHSEVFSAYEVCACLLGVSHVLSLPGIC